MAGKRYLLTLDVVVGDELVDRIAKAMWECEDSSEPAEAWSWEALSAAHDARGGVGPDVVSVFRKRARTVLAALLDSELAIDSMVFESRDADLADDGLDAIRRNVKMLDDIDWYIAHTIAPGRGESMARRYKEDVPRLLAEIDRLRAREQEARFEYATFGGPGVSGPTHRRRKAGPWEPVSEGEAS